MPQEKTVTNILGLLQERAATQRKALEDQKKKVRKAQRKVQAEQKRLHDKRCKDVGQVVYDCKLGNYDLPSLKILLTHLASEAPAILAKAYTTTSNPGYQNGTSSPVYLQGVVHGDAGDGAL